MGLVPLDYCYIGVILVSAGCLHIKSVLIPCVTVKTYISGLPPFTNVLTLVLPQTYEINGALLYPSSLNIMYSSLGPSGASGSAVGHLLGH